MSRSDLRNNSEVVFFLFFCFLRVTYFIFPVSSEEPYLKNVSPGPQLFLFPADGWYFWKLLLLFFNLPVCLCYTGDF